MFNKTLDPVIAVTVIAVMDIFLFVVVGAWTVGGGETMMTGLIAQLFLGDDLKRIPFWDIVFPPHADYWKSYISLGMFFGAFVSAVRRHYIAVRIDDKDSSEPGRRYAGSGRPGTVVLDAGGWLRYARCLLS